MILFHVTREAVLADVLREGLRPDKAQTRAQRVWLCSMERRWWGVQHVSKRHACRVEDCRIIRVKVSAKDIRFLGNGLAVCDKLIPPCDIQSVTVPELVLVRR